MSSQAIPINLIDNACGSRQKCSGCTFPHPNRSRWDNICRYCPVDAKHPPRYGISSYVCGESRTERMVPE
jgi:hypothetical protein